MLIDSELVMFDHQDITGDAQGGGTVEFNSINYDVGYVGQPLPVADTEFNPGWESKRVHGLAASIFVLAWVTEELVNIRSFSNIQVEVWDSDDGEDVDDETPYGFVRQARGVRFWAPQPGLYPHPRNIPVGLPLLSIIMGVVQRRYIRLKVVIQGEWISGKVFARVGPATQFHAGLPNYYTNLFGDAG